MLRVLLLLLLLLLLRHVFTSSQSLLVYTGTVCQGGKLLGPKGPIVSSRRLQPSAEARKKPPVGGLNFLVYFKCLFNMNFPIFPPMQRSVLCVASTFSQAAVGFGKLQLKTKQPASFAALISSFILDIYVLVCC